MESTQPIEGKGVSNANLGRHQSQCSICNHPQREALEHDYLHYISVSWLVSQYRIPRYSWYRHVHALGLDQKRRANLLSPLERYIERGDSAPCTGSAFLKALQLLMELTGAGREVKSDGLSPKEMLERMSQEEREAFAKDGSIPDWISGATDATPGDGQEDAMQSVATKNETLQ
jgi:hypothetical protein